MLSNYNLFNDEKVDALMSTFLEKNCDINTIEKFIIELMNYFNLEIFCSSISLSSNDYLLAAYSRKNKELIINYKKMLENFSKISNDYYFIKANIYRIILHEIKHILQHKMVYSQDNQLFKIFQTEFHNGIKCLIAPSEVNADIESTLVLIKNYNSNHILYDKQLAFSANLINYYYFPKCIVHDYCLNNDIKLVNIDSLEKFIYGIDYDLTSCKNIIKK